MIRWSKLGLLLGQRRRRWTNSRPTLGQRLMFAGQWQIFLTRLVFIIINNVYSTNRNTKRVCFNVHKLDIIIIYFRQHISNCYLLGSVSKPGRWPQLTPAIYPLRMSSLGSTGVHSGNVWPRKMVWRNTPVISDVERNLDVPSSNTAYLDCIFVIVMVYI